MQATVVEKRVITKWGHKNSNVQKIVDKIELYVRPGTSDVRGSRGDTGGVIHETLVKHVYENRNVPHMFGPDDVLLDLGANIGTVTATVLAVGGRVYAYEPEPENFHMLERNIRELNPAFVESNYELHNKGVNAESGQCTLSLCKNNPTRKYNSKYRHSIIIDHRSGNSVQIECVGIERLLLEVHPDVNAIKMDIEGAEVPILEIITEEMLVNVQKMVCEYTFDAYPSMEQFWSIIKRLKSIFPTVHFTGVNKYTIRPPQSVIVYCVKKKPVVSILLFGLYYKNQNTKVVVHR